ncbi:lysophospholipid acyltransferase family protein [Phenylobacterium sp. LjRoot219]|uniref:lysophospholipid acyltransferase family protein n=1 Tax=Phenylobacterium sp. LjRoot219 TaxID=3342283 RepID=UPI003ED0B4EE
MKNVLRNDGVQAALGWVLGTYLRVILRTVRWRHENVECVEPVLAGDSGAIALFWHGRIPLCLATAPQWWRKRTRAFVSPSADGEFIAQALAMSGFPAIRISSAKKGDAAKARQAVAAIREAVTWVADGGALVVTPDGPRGPNEIIAPGALQIARRSGQPVFLMGIAANPATQLKKTWDKVMFAAPFGRGAVVWEGPLHVPAEADEAAIAALVEDWSARLSAVTRRAEALVGRTPVDPHAPG